METMYESEVTSKGGLTGHVSSKDGALDVDVFMPSGKDSDKEGTTPEQLFAGQLRRLPGRHPLPRGQSEQRRDR